MKTNSNKTQQGLSLNPQEKPDNSKLSGELVKKIPDTPFTLVTREHDVMITIGQDVVKTGFANQKEAEDYIEAKPWELILTATAIYTMYIQEIKTTKKNENSSKQEKSK